MDILGPTKFTDKRKLDKRKLIKKGYIQIGFDVSLGELGCIIDSCSYMKLVSKNSRIAQPLSLVRESFNNAHHPAVFSISERRTC